MPHVLTINLIVVVVIYNYFQPPQSCNVDHVMLWAAFTLAVFGFLRASELTCNSSSFDPTVHLCLRDVTFIPNIESPNHMLVSIKQSKTDPFRKVCTLTIARSTTSVLFSDGYERLPATTQTSCFGPFVYRHQWQMALPCLLD